MPAILTDIEPGQVYAVSFGAPTKECTSIICSIFPIAVAGGGAKVIQNMGLSEIFKNRRISTIYLTRLEQIQGQSINNQQGEALCSIIPE